MRLSIVTALLCALVPVHAATLCAGAAKADYVDSLDLFHTMEAYFTWYPHGVEA